MHVRTLHIIQAHCHICVSMHSSYASRQMYTLFIYSHAFCHICPCKYSSYTSRHMCSPFIYIQALCHICACMHSSYTSKHMYALFWPSFPVSVSLPVLGLGWLNFLLLAFPINSVFSLTPSISHLVFLCSESEILLCFQSRGNLFVPPSAVLI